MSYKILCLNLHKVTFLQCCSYFRFVALAAFEVQCFPHFYKICRKFPPKFLCDQDQVPLPFVATQESNCALWDDMYMRISCPDESLRKRKSTMHVAVSASEGEDLHGHTSMICKGSPRDRNKPYEKLLCCPRVLVCFQKKHVG